MSRNPNPNPNLNRYYTPRWAVDQMIREVLPVVLDRIVAPATGPRIIVEPSAGNGAIALPIAARFPGSIIRCLDVERHEYAPGVPNLVNHTGEPLEAADLADPGPAPDLIVGNPPYKLAREHVDICKAVAPTLFLLRLNFAATVKRSEWFRGHPPSDIFVLANRPSFSGPDLAGRRGTDQTEYAWFFWLTTPADVTKFTWLSAVPPQERK